MQSSEARHIHESSCSEKGWRLSTYNQGHESDTLNVSYGDTWFELFRNNQVYKSDLWAYRVGERQHSFLASFKPLVPSLNLPVWQIKKIDLLDSARQVELNRLNIAVGLSTERFIFGEVSDNLTTCIALDLGYGIKVRITAYYGDFSSYFLSFFMDDEIIRQEHLDFENTVKGIKSVFRQLKIDAARQEV